MTEQEEIGRGIGEEIKALMIEEGKLDYSLQFFPFYTDPMKILKLVPKSPIKGIWEQIDNPNKTIL